MRKHGKIYRSIVKHIKLPHNIGLSETLNHGMKIAAGKYIARMDFDDISEPERIEKQVIFMENNPSIGISGTYIVGIGDNIDEKVKNSIISTRPVRPSQMREFLLYKNPFFHPTVIMRKEVIIDNNLFYDYRYDSAEDYELWTRAIRKTELGNLEIPLLKYRVHDNQFSRRARNNSLKKVNIARLKYASWIFVRDKTLRKKSVKVIIRCLLNYVVLNIKNINERDPFIKFD